MFEDEKPESLNELFERTAQEHRESLYDDPEWSTKKWLHVKTLIEGVAVGILAADPYHHNYYIPKNFEKVMNFYIEELHKKLKIKNETIEICLIKYEGINKQILYKCPEFLQWNEIENGNEIVTRYDSTPYEKQFMSLDAMLRNASVHVRDYIRKTEAFDKKFEEEWKANHPT